MAYTEGYFVIQTCPCCGNTPEHGEVHVDWDHYEELQECPKCGQASIEIEWNTGEEITWDTEEDY